MNNAIRKVTSMKAAVYFKPGEPEEMRIVERPEPTPGPGEVLIRVEAISIESGEILARRFMDPGDPPGVPGYAAAGTIIALGDGVDEFAIGDRVASFAFSGAYAELRAVAASTCWKVPENLDIELAATVPVGFGTAAYALALAGLKSADTVLVQGVTGGVGIAAVQIAARAGATVFGTSRTAEALEHLYPLGLHHGIVAGKAPIGEQVRQLLDGRGATILIDAVGGDAFREGLAALDEGGRAVVVGIAGPGDKRVDMSEVLTRRLSIFGCFLGPVMGQPPQRALIAQTMADLAAGRLTMPVSGRFALAEVVEAQRLAETAAGRGRVIMRP